MMNSILYSSVTR